MLWDLALLLRPGDAQIVFCPAVKWLSEGVNNFSVQTSCLATDYLKHFPHGSQ